MSTEIATKQKSNEVIEGRRPFWRFRCTNGETHLAHWNVEGPNFLQLDVALKAQNEELFSAVDELAECLRALDALAIGGLHNLAKGSRIQERAVEKVPAKDSVAHLIECDEILVGNAQTLRQARTADDLEPRT